MKGIADTGFLVAFANRSDRHHEWAVRLAESLHEPLLTCEAVLAEAAFHLRSTGLVLAMLISYALGFAGMLLAYLNYRKRKPGAKPPPEKHKP